MVIVEIFDIAIRSRDKAMWMRVLTGSLHKIEGGKSPP